MSEYRRHLIDAAAAGALVLTANKRLARHLREHFDRRMCQAGVAAWRTPQIMSLDVWLQRCLEKSGQLSRLLEAPVAQRLWELVIAADTPLATEGAVLHRLGRAAMEAHQRLEDYAAAPEGWPLSPDQEAFLRWRQRYREKLAQEGWLDPAVSLAKVSELLARGDVALPERLLLAGFDEMPPRLRQLVAELRRCGVVVEEAPPPLAPRGEIVRCAVDGDRLGEIRRAACWVRGLLDRGAEHIGIVVPDLRAYRKDVERIFREELDPRSLLALQSEEQRFSLSLGAPLRDYPPVRAALEILAVAAKIPLDHAGFLLRSPYLGGASEELYGRSLCDARLRRRGAAEVRLSTLAREAAGTDLPRFAALTRKLAELLRTPVRRPPSAWSGHFLDCLAAAGWPGDRSLNSSEYQLCRALRHKLIDALGAFDRVVGEVTRGEALGLLQRLATEREFQPEGVSGPVQVVGFLEAGGLSFQHLWLLGLSADALPQGARPTALLPTALQVRHAMPHASPERELAFARLVLERSLAAATTVIVSHPTRDGDAEILPSPLIAAFPASPVVPWAESRAPVAVWHGRIAPESYDAGSAPTLAEGTCERGGVGVLRDQALCPFRAFARHRLGARALEEPVPGIDAATRGNLLHRALEIFWGGAKGSAALHALAPTELHRQVAASIQTALDERSAVLEGEPLLLRELERERLQQLLCAWLQQVEALRPDFTVERTEAVQRLTLGGLLLEGRIDRIDRLEDGAALLVDYKSGRLPQRNALCGDPLLEPQLPAYAVAAAEAPAGVALAGIKRGAMGWLGIGREGAVPHGAVALTAGDWQRQLELWRQQVETLARAFRTGEAAVKPVRGECRYCDLPSFCRVGELVAETDGGDDA